MKTPSVAIPPTLQTKTLWSSLLAITALYLATLPTRTFMSLEYRKTKSESGGPFRFWLGTFKFLVACQQIATIFFFAYLISWLAPQFLSYVAEHWGLSS